MWLVLVQLSWICRGRECCLHPHPGIYSSFHRHTEAIALTELDHLKKGLPKGMGCRRGQIIHVEGNE